MDRFDEMAVALVNKWLLGNEPAKIADIAAALRAAATVPKGYVRVGDKDYSFDQLLKREAAEAAREARKL